MPSPLPSRLCGSGFNTLIFLSLISPQSRSGGGAGIQTSGYAGEQFVLDFLAVLERLLLTAAEYLLASITF